VTLQHFKGIRFLKNNPSLLLKTSIRYLMFLLCVRHSLNWFYPGSSLCSARRNLESYFTRISRWSTDPIFNQR